MGIDEAVLRDCRLCPETIPSDPDIAGIGVIISFGLSGFLTTVAALVASALYNDISLWIIRIPDPQKRSFWLRVLDRVVLGLSDQQLITGFSMLIIGYIKLRSNITVYHFTCVTNLAMFSCSAHLASVISLRRYFQNHPEVAWIRVVFMSTFALLLALSLSLFGVGLPTYLVNMNCSAICLMPSYSNHSNVLGWILTAYLAVCYWAAYSYVFPNAEIFFTKWLFTKPLEIIEGCFKIHQFHERFMHRRPVFPSLPVSHFLQTIWWISSFTLSMLTRAWGIQNPSKLQGGSEGSWGFGQLLALFLILLPFLNGVEIFFEEYKGIKPAGTEEAISLPIN